MPSRKCTFKLYPSASELAAMERALAAHCKVYNTLLETSRLRHRAGLPAFNRTSVNQATKAIRNAHGWIAEHTLAQSLQVTGERLVKAFDAFFRRVEAGEAGGYPRFKSLRRFPGWGYKAEGQGYRLHCKAGDPTRYGSVTLSGIGTVSLRGRQAFLSSGYWKAVSSGCASQNLRNCMYIARFLSRTRDFAFRFSRRKMVLIP